MIQRIQSLFLLAAATLVSVLSFMPWWQGKNGDMALVFMRGTFNQEVFNTDVLFILFCLSLFSALLILGSIFLYRNRKLQMKITQLSGLMVSIVLGGSYWFVSKSISGVDGQEISGAFTFYFWLFVIAILLNAAARIFIKKDEDLVRSVDRFR